MTQEDQNKLDNSWIRKICTNCDGNGCELCDDSGTILVLPSKPKTSIKLSTNQEKVMIELRNAPFQRTQEEFPDDYHLWWETYIVYGSEEINIKENTATLKALEKKGLIKIIITRGWNSDRVKLLDH